jgi:predicted dithiol-disulfide oxidoreductase (DUF899 family)
MEQHEVVANDAWTEARLRLLAKEKEFTRLRDELSQARRDLPWEKAGDYVFDGPNGPVAFADIFEGRGQAIVFHFMFAPEWEAGCKHCSWWADNFERNVVHLHHRDVAFAAISRAPIAKLEAMKQRMGWTFPWYSSGGNDFNYDYRVSFRPEDIAAKRAVYNYRTADTSMSDLTGVSVFRRTGDGEIFHTYSAYGRGVDMLNTGYNLLDLVPKGRDEANLPFNQAWVRYRDRYETR